MRWTSIFCYWLEYNPFSFLEVKRPALLLTLLRACQMTTLNSAISDSGTSRRLVFDVCFVFVAWFTCRFRRPAWLPVLCLCLVWRRPPVSVYSVCVPCEFCTFPSDARQALAFPCFKTTSKASQQRCSAWQTDFFPWHFRRFAAETVVASCDITEDNQPTTWITICSNSSPCSLPACSVPSICREVFWLGLQEIFFWPTNMPFVRPNELWSQLQSLARACLLKLLCLYN